MGAIRKMINVYPYGSKRQHYNLPATSIKSQVERSEEYGAPLSIVFFFERDGDKVKVRRTFNHEARDAA